MGKRLDQQRAIRAKIEELEIQLRATINELVAAKVRLGLLQQLELDAPVPRRRASAVTSMTKREKIARVLRDGHPDGFSLEKIREELRRNYSEHIEKTSLSPMLNRLKREGFIHRGRLGKWYWSDNVDAAASLLP
ncbi:MAG TPA: hypothetical protein PKA57_10685 [Parvibaculum sp.]|uniref:hypothetical protein n=1 Tax=Parvibaculum sp. TaxID=2024848 RepID=UPI002B91E4AB|nr:hypothetical protein [Parvibaculum sp.]HMM15083.1 hypothetical protein [Parvibaculum sp.]